MNGRTTLAITLTGAATVLVIGWALTSLCAAAPGTTGAGPRPGQEEVPPVKLSAAEMSAILSALPESRSFHIGMGPWPYAFTQEALDETFDLVAAHTDLVMHHFDWGVPWPEALAGGPYHPSVESQLSYRASKRRPGQKVYLALAPQASDRDGLAGYWGDEWDMERPGEWAKKDFDDPDVLLAFTNYARDMINRFAPDYFAYGIEVTNSFAEDDPAFDRFLVLAEHVYTTLKRENPELPIFATLATISQSTDVEGLRSLAGKVMPYSDYVAISTYPFWSFSDLKRRADPRDIPSDWFSRWATFAPDKPFAVAETSYIAEDLVMDQYQVHMRGTERWQAEYVRLLCEELNSLDAEFVAWFIPRDYDEGWEYLRTLGVEQFLKAWRDTGLVDGGGKPRQSLAIWDAWLHLPRVRKKASDPLD